MSDTYIIEVQSAAAGVVIKDRGGFRFFSASTEFARLDGRAFRNPGEAEKAAARHASARAEQRRS